MNSTGERLIGAYRRLSPTTKAIALIVLVVLLANGMYVFGLANGDPISWTAGISHHLCRLTCGRPAIDPNVGFVTQTLGHEAAMDILHGHFPWWTYTQGLGQPLAGEMQSGALFPLTLLFAFPAGLLWFHISLEVIAGVSTYFLARRLSLPVFFATFGGILFALNGTYAWLGNSVLNPVAFLPMAILGVEMVYDSASSAKNRGWYILAIALALSLYAGFPEVAYIDGLFVVGWAVVRFFNVPRLQRFRAARRVVLGGAMGVVLALPILVPFYDDLKVGFIGSHTSAVDGALGLPHFALPTFFDPYVYGPIFSDTRVNAMWGGIGGYFGASVCALALLGLFGSKQRPLRIFLGAWTLVAMAGTFNFLDFHKLWNLIPVVSRSSFERYSTPGCELAIIVLAAFGLYDFTQSVRAKRLLTTTTAVMVLVIVWCAYEARSYQSTVAFASRDIHIAYLGLQALPFISLFFLLVFGRLHRFSYTPFLLALVVVVESLLLFFVPQAEAPKQITVDYSPITFLQKNLDQERFMDFEVLYPNWGTYFGINELSDIDLPFPKAFKNFIETNLLPGLTPGNQFVAKGGRPGVPIFEHAVLNHFKQYEDASVKYLLMPSSVSLLPGLAKKGVTQVFHDSLATIYEMPQPRTFFSTPSSCTVTSSSDNKATLNCTTATTLLRTELSMKGWKAFVNGNEVPITTVHRVYQEVSVPSGHSTVTYAFSPPHERDALIVGFLGGLFLIGSLVNERRRFIPTRRPPPPHS